MSLNNLASSLSALGHREAALAAAQEAVDLYRALASSRPDAFTPDLARSLNNLASFLSALGHREAALAAAQEAVDLCRALASSRPDAFTPDLATSLNNLANRFQTSGGAGALAAAQEAVTQLRVPFLALPTAHAQRMAVMCGVYVKACEANGAKPDLKLLGPIMEPLSRAMSAVSVDEA